MPSRISTLLREDAIDLGKPFFKDKNDRKNSINNATEIQNEILYNGDVNLYNTCIICDEKLNGKKTDHFLSAIIDKRARFRENKMLIIGHPLNLVYCCKGCNNETKKSRRIEEIPRINNYYKYLLEYLPTNKITEEEWDNHSCETQISEDKRLERIKNLHSKHIK